MAAVLDRVGRILSAIVAQPWFWYAVVAVVITAGIKAVVSSLNTRAAVFLAVVITVVIGVIAGIVKFHK